ncbi:hypothetical protein BDF14DRAFT_1769071 [Spinellus fusiger]|nr:hypothetical protein BDF14DRAFT_1769071 [Spinellus fusiger]
MIIVKGKRNKRYQPRHWFPLRGFVLETNNLMFHGWTLCNDRDTIEFGALCDQERSVWLEELSKAIENSNNNYEKMRENDLEHLFISSFDLERSKNHDETTLHSAVSYSSLTSASSYPSLLENVRISRDMTPLSPMDNASTTSHSSIYDSQERVHSNTSKWGSLKTGHYNHNRQAIDNRFEDICTTPLLKARYKAQVENSNTFNSWRLRSYIPKAPSIRSFRQTEDNSRRCSTSSSILTSPYPIHSSSCTPSTTNSPQGRIHGDSMMNSVQRKPSLPFSVHKTSQLILFPTSTL